MAAILTDGEPDVNTFRECVISQSVDNGGMDFAANLRAIRNLRGLTQAQLAELCGWDVPTRITNYESGSDNPRNRRKPDLDHIPVIARALRVPVELLFSETPPESLVVSNSRPARLDPAIIDQAIHMARVMLAPEPFDPAGDVALFIAAYEQTADATLEGRSRFDAALAARTKTKGGGLERSTNPARGAGTSGG